MAWATSDRAQRLPPNWPTIRTQVRVRAGDLCQAHSHHPQCPGVGAEADHITPGDDHTLSNLQWLSTPCHQAKTAREAAARNRARAAMRRKPDEQHPGALR